MVTRIAQVTCACVAAALLMSCGAGAKAGHGLATTRLASTGPTSTGPTSTGPQTSGAPSPGGRTAAPADQADACALVTQQEASAAFGAQSSPGQLAASAAAGTRACAYFANANDDSLQVSLLQGASQSRISAIKQSVQLPGAVTSTVSGIGDSATVMRAGPTAVVTFIKHSDLVIVILNMIGQPAPVHAVTVLAMDAAARL